MKFDILRQTRIPAMLTLAVIAVAAMFGYTGAADTETTSLPLLGGWLLQFQNAFPIWAHIAAGAAILTTGWTVGRIAVRYNLYAVSSRLSAPLYGLAACGIAIGPDYLVGFLAALLLALAVKYYCRGAGSGYNFDAVFRASLCLGLLPLVYAPAALLVALLLPAVALFRRTLREVIVALVGVLLPAAIVCYVSWCPGEAFFAPIEALINASNPTGEWMPLLIRMPLGAWVMLGGVVALALVSLFAFFSNIYAAGTKSRAILNFNVFAVVLSLFLCGTPGATSAMLPLFAVPVALLIPLFFVRIRRAAALAIYLCWIAAIFVL